MRQLFSACRNVFLLMGCAMLCINGAKAEENKGKPANPLEQELQAAFVTENAVLTGITDDGKSPASQDKLEKVAHIYARIVERNPKNVAALNACAEYLWRIERRQEAMAKWTAAETLEPGNAVVINHLGGCHLALGDAKRATEYFERAAMLDPGNALYQFNAGNTSYLFRHEMTTGTDTAEAVMLRSLDHFRRAAKIDPFNVEYARAYAETFYMVQPPDWNGALQAWTHYLEITDQKDFAYSNLARVNIKLGHNKDARDNLARIENAKFAPLKEHLLQQMR